MSPPSDVATSPVSERSPEDAAEGADIVPLIAHARHGLILLRSGTSSDLYFDTDDHGDANGPSLDQLMVAYRSQGYNPRVFVRPSFGPNEWQERVAPLQGSGVPDQTLQMKMRARVLHQKHLIKTDRHAMPITIEMAA